MSLVLFSVFNNGLLKKQLSVSSEQWAVEFKEG